MQHFVLDTCAMIAFFRDEAGAEKVKEIPERAARSECLLLMHNASVAELYYESMRGLKSDGEDVLTTLRSYPIKYLKISLRQQ